MESRSVTVPPTEPGNLGRQTGAWNHRSIFRRSDLAVVVLSSLAGLLTHAVLNPSGGEETRPSASTSPTDGRSPLEQPQAPITQHAIGARRTESGSVQHSQYQPVTFQDTDPGIPLDLFGEPLLPDPSPKTISYMGGVSPRPNEQQPLLIPGGIAPPTEDAGAGQTFVSGELTTAAPTQPGAACRYKLHDASGQELLIILTPLIVQGDEDLDRLQREESRRVASIYGNEEQRSHARLVSQDSPPDLFPPAPPVDQESESGSETVSEMDQIPEDLSHDSLLTISPSQTAIHDPWAQLSDPSATSLPRGNPTGLADHPQTLPEVPSEPLASQSKQPQAGGTAPKMKWVFPSWIRFASPREPLSTPDVPSREPALPERGSNTKPLRNTDPTRNSTIKPSSYYRSPRQR